MCIDWDMIWNALSSFATIAAVITAFVIVRYDHKISNRKKLKIEYKHMTGQVTYDGFRDGRSVDSILIKFVNIGNRKIIIDGLKFAFPDSHSFAFTSLISEGETDLSIPCSLEIEEAKQIVIPYSHIIRLAKLAEGKGKRAEEIVIVATDTTDKEYRFKTGVKYCIYLDKENSGG